MVSGEEPSFPPVPDWMAVLPAGHRKVTVVWTEPHAGDGIGDPSTWPSGVPFVYSKSDGGPVAHVARADLGAVAEIAIRTEVWSEP